MPITTFITLESCRQAQPYEANCLCHSTANGSSASMRNWHFCHPRSQPGLGELPRHLPKLNQGKIPIEYLTRAALSSFFTEGGNGFLKTSSAKNFSSPESFWNSQDQVLKTATAGTQMQQSNHPCKKPPGKPGSWKKWFWWETFWCHQKHFSWNYILGFRDSQSSLPSCFTLAFC